MILRLGLFSWLDSHLLFLAYLRTEHTVITVGLVMFSNMQIKVKINIQKVKNINFRTDCLISIYDKKLLLF